jgi:hypothetical protein
MFPERLQKDWRSPIYAFFQAKISIKEVDGRRVHDFTCNAVSCKGKGLDGRRVRRYLDTGDSKSTSSLRRHAIKCWGGDIISQADKANDLGTARDAVKGAELKDGSITAVFERTAKGKITYSHRPHTNAETR